MAGVRLARLRRSRGAVYQLKGSNAQRTTALRSLVPFFRAHVGKSVKPSFAALFDPLVALPASIASVTRVDRGFTDTPDRAIELRLEDFEKPTGTSSYGQANQAQGITIEHLRPLDHDQAQRAAAIVWTAAGRERLFQANWTPPGSGRDIAAYRTLEFRVSRRCDEFCDDPDPLNRTPATDFSVQLVQPDGRPSPAVRLSDHFALRGPVGVGDDFFQVVHPILATARIPLSAFGPGITSVRGVRFTFDRTPTGAVYLANVRLSRRGTATVSSAAVAASEVSADAARDRAATAPVRASIAAIRRVTGADPAARAAAGGAVEIEVVADGRLPVTDALPTLRVGKRQFRSSRYPRGRVYRVIFTVAGDEFAGLEDDAPAEMRLGEARRFDLGRLNKSALR